MFAKMTNPKKQSSDVFPTPFEKRQDAFGE